MSSQQANSSAQLLYFATCDDIRAEEGGKITLVGLYGRGVRLPRMPATLPKLCFLAQFLFITDPKVLTLRVISPRGTVLFEARDLKTAPSDEKTTVPKEYRPSQLIVQIAPMPLNEEGRYRVDFMLPNGPTIETDFFVFREPSPVPLAPAAVD